MVFEDVKPIDTSKKAPPFSVTGRDENIRPKKASILERRQSQAVVEALQEGEAFSCQRRTSSIRFELNQNAAFRGCLVGDQILELEQFSKALKTEPRGLARISCCANKVAVLDSIVDPQEFGSQRASQSPQENPLLVRLFHFETDNRQLIDLERAVDRNAGYEGGTKPESRSQLRSSWYDEECMCLVAFIGSRLVGSICGAIKSVYVGSAVHHAGFAFDLLVHPKHLGIITAKSLMYGLITEFRKRRADWQYLFTSESNPHSCSSVVGLRVADVQADCGIILHFWNVDSIRDENFISSIVVEKTATESMDILSKRFKDFDMCPTDFSEIIRHENHQGTILVHDYTLGIESVAGLSIWEGSAIHVRRRSWFSTLFSTRRSSPEKTRTRMLYGLYADGPKGLELLSLLVNFVNNLSYAENYAAMYCPLPSVSPLAPSLPSNVVHGPSICCLLGNANASSPKLKPSVFCDPRDF